MVSAKAVSSALPAVQASTPRAFGYKCGWFAVRDRSVDRVVATLGLKDGHPANWDEGTAAAYDDTGRVFVTPPVNGWVLVVASSGLPTLGDSNEKDEIVPMLVHASERLGSTVQFFFSHRVSETHAWMMATNGKLDRAFGYSGDSGETFKDVGAATPAEKALDPKERKVPTEDTVMSVAGKWSLNPQLLEQLKAPPGIGWLGRFP